MSDLITYLTMDGQTYIASQVEIAFENNQGGSCPDYVALDFRNRHVVVVEETEAWNIQPLCNRIRERDKRWFTPLAAFMLKKGIVNPDWGMRMLGIVRPDRIEAFNKAFAQDGDVSFVSIEECIFPWKYWDTRMSEGLPGGNGVTYKGRSVGVWASKVYPSS
ncbi:hypothetical protein [Novacetimonas pomaceti]|uniref:hypothetical protein n=1 Tax=Novacetimonas pomaceti TaxID=2021998 RepID=UPI0010578D2A|nr:hypothetical protein [Novacetimonas pomaceti]